MNLPMSNLQAAGMLPSEGTFVLMSENAARQFGAKIPYSKAYRRRMLRRFGHKRDRDAYRAQRCQP